MKHRSTTAALLAPLLTPLAGLSASLAGALPAAGADVPFTERVIATPRGGLNSVFATDMDGDADTDVLSVSGGDWKIAWYESDGGSPPTFTKREIVTNATGWSFVFATDLDSDGDTDVLTASYHDDTVAWYENDGGSPPTFTGRVISSAADGPRSVFATDVDGDGDTDVLSASFRDNKIAWYENDGGSPSTFTARVISTNAIGASSVFATDVDGDGDTDVLSASVWDNKIAWYENDGGSPPTFTARVISTNANGASSVFATDMDGDGKTDVLSASGGNPQIAWYENGGGSPPTFTERVISTSPYQAVSVFAADLDRDGDADVLSASWLDDRIAWYESDGGSLPSFTEHLITTAADNPKSVFATDMDADGDTDYLSASMNDGKVRWYENLSPCGRDADCDGDVDLRDAALFQAAFSGLP